MVSFFGGLGTGLSLIMAIGAQNAFVLKQGIMRQHVIWVCLFCALSDAVLVALGVAGMSMITTQMPWFAQILKWGGIAFLLCYGAKSFRAALIGGDALRAEGQRAGLIATMATVAAITWLNPHVWLDTVVLLGAISAQWPSKLNFAIGAMTGSFLFFFALGYGARLLAPVFARPRAWQVLEVCVGIMMWSIALKLIIS